MDATRLILKARRGAGLTQRQLAARAATSQATLSAYESGRKIPSLAVAERIVEAAGYHLDLVTEVKFTRHEVPRVHPFWVPDRLWRGKLPECFARVVLDDPDHYERVRQFNLRRRPARRQLYQLLLRRGTPDELIDWIDGALLVDLWGDLKIPSAVRDAWEPAVRIAGNGPREIPTRGIRYEWRATDHQPEAWLPRALRQESD